ILVDNRLVQCHLFVFRAEDGIRDFHVTGVQTCALPIYDSAEAALRSNQSALKAAQAQLANANEQLSYTALVSEADGVITERQAEIGRASCRERVDIPVDDASNRQ